MLVVVLPRQSDTLRLDIKNFRPTAQIFYTTYQTNLRLQIHTMPPALKVPRTVSDLLVLPLQLPLQPSFQSLATHYLYIRPDAPPQPTPDTPRALFLSNVPADATEEGVRKLFRDMSGAVVDRVAFESGRADEAVLAALGLQPDEAPAVPQQQQPADSTGAAVLGKRKRGEAERLREAERAMRLPGVWEGALRKSGSAAVVLFVDVAARKRAWKACRDAVKDGRSVEWSGGGLPLGEERYWAHHALRYPGKEQLQDSVNAYLTAFTALEDARAKQLARQRSVPDADGFITVTRGGRAGPARLEEAQAAQERLKEREKKRITGDFYRFQTREERKKRENDLKRKFEGDRRRVEEMRRRKGKIKPET